MGYELVGKVWDLEEFEKYVNRNKAKLKWASSVTMHHTASPSLKQRLKGWTIQHMKNLRHFYKNKLGWSAGPHLFTDEDQVFGMSSLFRRGVHARSFNRYSIGIEGLGNFDTEKPTEGRGLEVCKTSAACVAILLKAMGRPINSSTVKFHRFDKKTSKSCPGKLVNYQWFIDMVRDYADNGYENEDSTEAVILADTAPKIPNWTEYEAHAGRYFAPVKRLLMHVGMSESAIWKALKVKGGKFVLGANELELAYYDRDKKETWAPVDEILNINKVS